MTDVAIGWGAAALLAVAVIALLASLFCQVLAAVFDKAIRIKNENDLTI